MPFDSTILKAPVTAAAHGLRSIAFGKLTDTAAPMLTYVQSALPVAADHLLGQAAKPGGSTSPGQGGLALAMSQGGRGGIAQAANRAMSSTKSAAQGLEQTATGLGGALAQNAIQAVGSGQREAGLGNLAQLSAGDLPSVPEFGAIPTAPALGRLQGLGGAALAQQVAQAKDVPSSPLARRSR